LRAVAAAEILDEGVVEVDGELRMPARDEVGLDGDVAVWIAPEDILTRLAEVAAPLGAIDADEDFGLGNGQADERGADGSG
jgi:hypothetical protein